MAIVDFDSETWTDPWFMDLPPLAKIVFVYSWTNSHKGVACLYTISTKTIANETGLAQKQVEEALERIKEKVLYDPKACLLFVKNHVRRQFLRGELSPKVRTAIEKCLALLPRGHWLIGAFLDTYADQSFSYAYPIDTVSGGYTYPPSGGVGEGKGEEGGSRGDPPPAGGSPKEPPRDPDAKVQRAPLVWLRPSEYERLVKQFGPRAVAWMIEKLDAHKGKGKGVKYADDNRAIRSWVIRAYRDEAGLAPGSGPGAAPPPAPAPVAPPPRPRPPTPAEHDAGRQQAKKILEQLGLRGRSGGGLEPVGEGAA